MKTPRAIAGCFALAGSLLLIGGTAFHLELAASYPEAEQALAEAPTEIWLRFTVTPDMTNSGFSVQGPNGAVELGDIAMGENPHVIRAEVTGAMPPGSYTLSWVGAPLDDHAVRGRFSFSVDAAR